MNTLNVFFAQKQTCKFYAKCVIIKSQRQRTPLGGLIMPAKPEEKGTKNDQGKPRLAFIPAKAVFGIGQAFEYGAKKYADWNYKKGLSATRLSSALLRHVFAWLGGEDKDPESGLLHLY